MATKDAVREAAEVGLDLVEVSPMAEPPVCRMMDFGKFQYSQSRRARESRKAVKEKTASNVLREVRLKPRIGPHDLDTKIKQARRLLGKGFQVRVSVRFRGRENQHRDLGMVLLKRVSDALVDEAAMVQNPRMDGSNLSVILTVQH